MPQPTPMLPAELPSESGAASAPAARVRLVGLGVALPALAVLTASGLVRPDVRGYDTHTQLGLPACGLMRTTGMPCPTCGMTTAFAHMARGQVAQAMRAQAFGVALFVATLAAGLAGSVQAIGGHDLLVRARPRMWWLWALLGGLTAGWALKMALGVASGTLPVR